jgi:hypothetical protein
VEAEAVIAAAEAHEEEIKACEELPKLKEELVAIRLKYDQLSVAYDDLAATLAVKQRESAKELDRWRIAGLDLCEEVLKTRFFKNKKAVSNALRKFIKEVPNYI